MQPHTNLIEAYHLLHNGILALSRAEQQGICVDVEYLDRKHAFLNKKISRLERKFEESKFYKDWEKSIGKAPNPNSGVQLGKFLYEVKGLKPPKLTDSGKGSTDKEAITTLNIKELNGVLEARKLRKIRDTYLDGFNREQVNGVIHPSFNLHLVKTYRSSSSNPNFQNIPNRDKEAMQLTRGALFPREGHQLLEVDYGQLEVRIAACYNQDKKLIHDILNGDMHADMAKELFMIDDFDKNIPEHDYLRAATKNGFVFPEFYGSYYKNTADDLAYKWGELPHGRWKPGQGVPMPIGTLADHFISKGIKSYDQFVKHVQRIENEFWNVRYREYTRWKEKWWKMYQKNGYIETFTGFRCTEIMGKNDAINYPIQGAAFHCLLWSLIEVDKMLQIMGWRSRIIGQIHDSIVLDVYPPELPMLIKHVRKITTVDLPAAWEWISVPLDVDFEICDVDASWAEKRNM